MDKRYLILLGIVAGFLSAVLGVGGGAIIVPALVLLFGFSFKKAAFTSLVTIVPTALVGVISRLIIRPNDVHFGIAGIVIIGAFIGAWTGVKVVKMLKTRWLTLFFAILLLFIGLKLTGLIVIPNTQITGETSTLLLVLLGLVAGLGSSLLGVGSGVIMVPSFNLFFGLTIYEASATSLAVIVPMTLAAAIFHSRISDLDRGVILRLVPSAFIGAMFGAWSVNIISATTLKIGFGIFMIFVCFKMFFYKEEKKEGNT